MRVTFCAVAILVCALSACSGSGRGSLIPTSTNAQTPVVRPNFYCTQSIVRQSSPSPTRSPNATIEGMCCGTGCADGSGDGFGSGGTGGGGGGGATPTLSPIGFCIIGCNITGPPGLPLPPPSTTPSGPITIVGDTLPCNVGPCVFDPDNPSSMTGVLEMFLDPTTTCFINLGTFQAACFAGAFNAIHGYDNTNLMTWYRYLTVPVPEHQMQCTGVYDHPDTSVVLMTYHDVEYHDSIFSIVGPSQPSVWAHASATPIGTRMDGIYIQKGSIAGIPFPVVVARCFGSD
jgi:hypothetical protein